MFGANEIKQTRTRFSHKIIRSTKIPFYFDFVPSYQTWHSSNIKDMEMETNLMNDMLPDIFQLVLTDRLMEELNRP